MYGDYNSDEKTRRGRGHHGGIEKDSTSLVVEAFERREQSAYPMSGKAVPPLAVKTVSST